MPLASVLVAPPSSWPSRFCYQAALRSFGHGAFASLLASRAIAGGQYSLWGSNPRPMAHKTIALTTELRELMAASPPNALPQLRSAASARKLALLIGTRVTCPCGVVFATGGAQNGPQSKPQWPLRFAFCPRRGPEWPPKQTSVATEVCFLPPPGPRMAPKANLSGH